jgi:integrase
LPWRARQSRVTRYHGGDIPLIHFTAAHVRTLRDGKAGKPGAARNRVNAIKAILTWGIENTGLLTNAARDVKARMPKSQGFHSWTPDEVKRFESHHPVGSTARLAMALLLFTGQRRGDVVTFGPDNVRDGSLVFVQGKSRKLRPGAMTVPILPALRTIIAATPTPARTFLATTYGKPFTAAGFGNWFRDRCNEAGLPGCTAHGLRKAGATIAAERGATISQLMAIFGWTKPEMAAHYTRSADQKKLAGSAMHLIESAQIVPL